MISESAKLKMRAALATANLERDVSDHPLVRKFLRPAEHAAVQYSFSNDPGLLHQYYQLREEMFVNVWGLNHFQGERDYFDGISETLLAHQGRQCLGGARVTFSSPDKPHLMPMEQRDLRLSALFPELDLHETTYCEISRLAGIPEARSGVTFSEFTRHLMKRVVDSDAEYVFTMSPLPSARFYSQTCKLFGLKWDIRMDVTIPDHEEYEGIRMVLSVMDLNKFRRSSARSEILQPGHAKVLPA